METPRKSRGWIWIFVVLAVLTVIATVTLAVHNIRQQLTSEQLQLAMDRWKAKGPGDYILVYTTKTNNQNGSSEDHYVVKVKDGRATEVLVNGLPLSDDRQLAYYGMHRLLQNIERFQEIDAEPGRPKVFTRGIFDGKTGSLAWYVRRVMGSRQRIEITVESFQPHPPTKQ